MDDIPLPLPFLMDGAIGTALESLGMPDNICPETWMIEHLEILERVQRTFLDAGADVLCAPTGSANRPLLAAYGKEEQVAFYNRALVERTRLTAGERAKVLGVLSTTGLALPPQGEADIESFIAVYREQVIALGDAGVDAFLVDSIACVAEARAAILSVREETDKPVFVTFSCDGDGRTKTGGDILAALIICQGMGADAFGIGSFYGDLSELLDQILRLSSHATIPLMVCPGGDPVGSVWTPSAFAAAAPVFAEAGVRIYGGGADAPHIAALRAAMDAIDFKRLPLPELELDSDTLHCASEREARFISPLIDVGDGIICSPHFVEDLLASEDAPTGASKIVLQDEDDLDIFAENQYMIQEALCLSSDNPSLLAKALRLYNGRAFYDGTGDLEPDVLLPLVKKYGLVVL